MRVILVDDELAAIKVLTFLLADFPQVELVASFTETGQVLQEIEELRPDVVFLDIEMGQTDGLELAGQITAKVDCEIVFVTAYSQYAVTAFELDARDYLLKPVQKNRLEQTLARLEARQEKADPIRLHLLNDFLDLGQQGKSVYWRTKKTKELFAYLYLNSGPVDKSILIEDVFPERDLSSAQALLHTTVYQLRKILTDLGFSKSIRYANESYSLTIDVPSDLDELEAVLQEQDPGEKELKRLLDLYKADLLEKEDYFWLAEKRESVRDLTRQVLHTFVRDKRHADKKDLREAALELLGQIEPLCDITAQAMLVFLGQENRKPQLKSYFEDYKRKLWLELKLRPNQETVSIYERYLN